MFLQAPLLQGKSQTGLLLPISFISWRHGDASTNHEKGAVFVSLAEELYPFPFARPAFAGLECLERMKPAGVFLWTPFVKRRAPFCRITCESGSLEPSIPKRRKEKEKTVGRKKGKKRTNERRSSQQNECRSAKQRTRGPMTHIHILYSYKRSLNPSIPKRRKEKEKRVGRQRKKKRKKERTSIISTKRVSIS